jgi:peptidoglycan/xylan/chitin deacetylase (PgdA/CDA1 family)
VFFDRTATPIIHPRFADYAGQGMITFSYDDGFNSAYSLALPLHEKYGIPCTFNIIGGRVEDFHISRFFDPFMLSDADHRGAEIASHGYYHDVGLTDKSDEDVTFELADSKRVLSQYASRVETIAIPFSQYDARVKALVAQHYSAARGNGGIANSVPPTDRYQLYSALTVLNTTTFAQIKTVIDDAVATKKWAILMLHNVSEAAGTTYEIKPALLEQILQYVSSLGKANILPVNTRDGIRFALGLGDYS